MASTVLSDVNFQTNVFRTTLPGEFVHRLAMYNSLLQRGLITPDAGYFQSIPKWQALSGDSVQITSSTTTTVNNVADYLDVGVWIEREKAWGGDDILKTVAGQDKDVTTAIAEMVGGYWANEVQRLSIVVAGGVMDTALASTHVKNDSGNVINIQGLIDAKQLLGDNMDLFTNIVMNSAVYAKAITEKIVTYDKGMADAYVTGEVPRILGLNTSVTDALAAVAGVYPSYIGLPGSIIYQLRPRGGNVFNNANKVTVDGIEVEINRKAETAGGQDVLISRVSMLVHVPGVKWGVSTTNPTDAQLGTGSNWTKVAPDNKLIRLIKYDSSV
jgi:hypothetical protein